MDQFFSEYSYCGNDPLHMIDPWGLNGYAYVTKEAGELTINCVEFSDSYLARTGEILPQPSALSSFFQDQFHFYHATFDFVSGLYMATMPSAQYMDPYAPPKTLIDSFFELDDAFWNLSDKWRNFEQQNTYTQTQMVEGVGLAGAGGYGAYKGLYTPRFKGTSASINKGAQARHIKDTEQWIKRGQGGYFKTQSDAQKVLDAVHSGDAKYLGWINKAKGQRLFEFNGGNGFNNSPGTGFVNQPTNKYILKGSTKVSVCPASPTKAIK